MVYLGVQYQRRHCCDPGAAAEALSDIAERFAAADGFFALGPRALWSIRPAFRTWSPVAYWDDVARFDAWLHLTGGMDGKSREGIGAFIEVLRPGSSRHETLFSSLGPAEASRRLPRA